MGVSSKERTLFVCADAYKTADHISPLVDASDNAARERQVGRLDELDVIALAADEPGVASGCLRHTDEYTPVVLDVTHITGRPDKLAVLEDVITGIRVSYDVSGIVDPECEGKAPVRAIDDRESSVAEQESVWRASRVIQDSSDVTARIDPAGLEPYRCRMLDVSEDALAQQEAVSNAVGVEAQSDDVTTRIDIGCPGFLRPGHSDRRVIVVVRTKLRTGEQKGQCRKSALPEAGPPKECSREHIPRVFHGHPSCL